MQHHSLKDIVYNQKMFKKQIVHSFFLGIKNAKKELKEINSNDKFILKEKNKLEKLFKKTKLKPSFDKLFFINPKRNAVFYIWWDENKLEHLILKYGKN